MNDVLEALSPAYTGCPRRNVPDFGRMFLMLKYTDITQNTYIQSSTVTEIMVFLLFHVLYLFSWRVTCTLCMSVVETRMYSTLLQRYERFYQVAKIPFVFSQVEYCDMHFVYWSCDGKARSAVEEYNRRFPDRSTPSRGLFTRIYQTLRETGFLSIAVWKGGCKND